RGFLSQVRSHWRGWNILLFEDRAGQHTASNSLLWAACLGIEIRLLPRATPELNAMETLWKQVKRDALGDRSTDSIGDPPKMPVSRSWRCVRMIDSVRLAYYRATSGSRSN